MSIAQVLQSLNAGTILEFFELDTSVIGGSEHYYFHAGTDLGNYPVVWKGITYSPWAVEATGFEVTAKGTLPRPQFRVANVTGAISSLVIEWEDLLGARLFRRRTFVQYLDGQPGADPTQELPDDIFYIERKVEENDVYVEFELASAMDLHGVPLPSRPILAGSCWSEYRGPECSYTGTSYFDVNDNPVVSADQDVCSKKPTGCKCRFGARANLPFGGFPAARTYKV